VIVYSPGARTFCTTGPTPVVAVVLSGSSLTTHAQLTMRFPGPATDGEPSMITLARPVGPVEICAFCFGSRMMACSLRLAGGGGGVCAIVGGGGQ
jgi:hypothetical protein